MKKAKKILQKISDNSQIGYNDSKPYWFSNHQSDDQKRSIVHLLQEIITCGLDSANEEHVDYYPLLRYARHAIDNARELAAALITVKTYPEVEWREGIDGTPEQIVELDSLMEAYTGIDAYVYCAQENLAQYLNSESYLDIVDAIDFFKE